jgi:hypothetical protein
MQGDDSINQILHARVGSSISVLIVAIPLQEHFLRTNSRLLTDLVKIIDKRIKKQPDPFV